MLALEVSMDSDRIVELVTDALIARGHHATYEYPGFCLLLDRDGTAWCTGTANFTWTLDHTTVESCESIASFDTGVRCEDVEDIDRIVAAIEATLAQAGADTQWTEVR